MKTPLLVLVVLVSMLAVLPRSALADRTIQWDTTAEWDAGIKGGVNDVAALATTTDNPAHLPENTLGVASVFGDAFLNDSADAETWRWLASSAGGCNDGGTQTISDTDTDGIDAGDGSLIFDHNAAETSTRTTVGPISGPDGGFRWVSQVRYGNVWATGAVLTLAVSRNPSSGSVRIWCGGYTPGPEGAGGGVSIEQVAGPGIKTAQPFIIADDGTQSDCGSSVGVATSPRVEIMRSGSTWSFRLDGGEWQRCLNMVSAPMYATFDLGTSGLTRTVVMVDSTRVYRFTPGPTPDTHLLTSDGFWMSPSTGGPATERITRITWEMRGPVGAYGWCTPAILNAGTGDLIAGIFICSDPGDSPAILVFTWDVPTLTDGPYLFRIYLFGSGFSGSSSPSYIVSIRLSLTGYIPPESQSGQNTLPVWLDEMIGLGTCGAIGFAVVFTLLILTKKMRDRTGGA